MILSPHAPRASLLTDFQRPDRALVRILSKMVVGLVIATAVNLVVQGATITLLPSLDNTIYSEADNASNGTGSLFAGRTPNGTVRRALLEFNLATSGIPAGAIINSVTVSLTQTKIGPAGTSTFEFHPLLSPWGEGSSFGTGAGGVAQPGDATWAFRFYSTIFWNSPGGDFGPASGTATLGTANTTYTFPSQSGLVADVQRWINDPSLNYGWILTSLNDTTATPTTAREFGSRNDTGAEPKLTVTYTPAPEPGVSGLLGAASLALLVRRFRPRRVRSAGRGK